MENICIYAYKMEIQTIEYKVSEGGTLSTLWFVLLSAGIYEGCVLATCLYVMTSNVLQQIFLPIEDLIPMHDDYSSQTKQKVNKGC